LLQRVRGVRLDAQRFLEVPPPEVELTAFAQRRAERLVAHPGRTR
jgi:hypothetical protein